MACTECQRRKKKCTDAIPCPQCCKRKVAHLCRLAQPKLDFDTDQEGNTPSSEDQNPAQLNSAAFPTMLPLLDPGAALEENWPPARARLWKNFDSQGDQQRNGGFWAEAPSPMSVRLRTALLHIPPRPYTDSFIDSWFCSGNYYDHAIYPPAFRSQYEDWWTNRRSGSEVSASFTCLLLRVYACSARLLSPDDGLADRIRAEMGVDPQILSNRMHNAAQHLSGAIPLGHGGLIQVQEHFIASYLHRLEGVWDRAWQSLSHAILCAYRTGLHQDSVFVGSSPFDYEMARRLWVLLVVWDCIMASFLGRPRLVNYADCVCIIPELYLDCNPDIPNLPSPFSHITLQFEIFAKVHAIVPSTVKNSLDASLAMKLGSEVQHWLANLPRVYNMKDTEVCWDISHPWIVYQRHLLRLIGWMTVFYPLKPYLVQSERLSTSSEGLILRSTALEWGFQVLDAAHEFCEHVSRATAGYSCVHFYLSDTLFALCSCLCCDEGYNVKNLDKILVAIKRGFTALEKLHAPTNIRDRASVSLSNVASQLRTIGRYDLCAILLEAVRKQPRPYGIDITRAISDPPQRTAGYTIPGQEENILQSAIDGRENIVDIFPAASNR